ncbi:DUF2179 domain-containing protein (plasmid) [Pontibacillus sp. ALD_SL1]|uniref:DUF2179 domain-containing protein n=1 Tax=Pontibacillus sp. ALD_SL1 TaxID=2777185 RepID=UPI001A973947|nr:DUF2179 domain-containing protein [Pontibacillus sp. ALD_SL1]QST02674.1 DUF2179 domain-containing protein [Pontibacillus sp. ALD_SL1]
MKDILLILVLQLLHVPTFTLRTVMLVKGKSLAAASLGFLEALIYVFGLSIVFSGEQNAVTMLVYAVGFAAGLFLGTLIERKLAIGYTTFQVITKTKNMDLVEGLRKEGYGVTLYEGEGIDSKRYKLDILTKRNQEKDLFQKIESYEPSAFIVVYEPKAFKGGFWLKSMKRRRKKAQTS